MMARAGMVMSPQPWRLTSSCGSDRWGTTTLQSAPSWTSQPTERQVGSVGDTSPRVSHEDEHPKASAHSIRTSRTNYRLRCLPGL